MKGIATCKNCLIELWKNDCEHCEAIEPVLKELEKEGRAPIKDEIVKLIKGGENNNDKTWT